MNNMSAYAHLERRENSSESGSLDSIPETRRRTRSVLAPQPPIDDSAVYPKDDKYGFLETGRDYEPTYVTHKYTDDEKITLAQFDSVDYLPSHSETYRGWLRQHRSPGKNNFSRWLVIGLIGFFVGFIGFLLHDLIEEIAHLKWDKVQQYIQDRDFGMACVFATGYSLVFIIFSAAIVVYWRPSAGGSGIPEVTGFLNGTNVRHIFNIQTLVVKFLSCVAAVGCGFPVGPEGPMIHIGALVGAGVSQFRSETLNIKLKIFEQFRNSEDKRNFVSAGAAAGVASAFGSPVGGLLFSMEEVSSFWSNTLSWQIFFCCMVSTFTTDLFNSAFNGFSYEGSFGAFKTERYILFNIDKGIDVNMLMFIPTIVIGGIGGMLGAAFTIMNLKMTRGRKRLLAKIKSPAWQKILRIIEPAFIMILVTVVSLFLPAAFSCSKFTCIEGQSALVPSENCLNDTRNPLHVEEDVVRYLCPRGTKWQQSNTTWTTNSTYNEMATLMFGTLESAVKHLFSRDTHLEFDFASLFTALAFYFITICWATGTSVACGALVPMLLVGGLYGRVIGLVMTKFFGVHSEDSGYWEWMDPGAFALIGAASFFGGVTRLTLAVTVIMMELTDDVQALLPVMVSVMVSKWVGDFFTHPVYHALLELKCIPFLDPEPRVTIDDRQVNLELFCAKDVMSSPVLTIRTKELVSVLAKLMLDTTHGGFPVITKNQTGEECFYGMITRQELTVLLMNENLFETDGSDDITESPHWIDYEQLSVEKIKDPQQASLTIQRYIDNQVYANVYIDLNRYINQSALSIQGKFSLQRTYLIFRTLGLRYLTVVDDSNVVIGIITRKDLMGFNIEENLSNVLEEQIQREGRLELNDMAAPSSPV